MPEERTQHSVLSSMMHNDGPPLRVIAERSVVACLCCHNGAMNMIPEKGNALDWALAFSIVLVVVAAVAMLLGFVSIDVLLQVVSALR